MGFCSTAQNLEFLVPKLIFVVLSVFMTYVHTSKNTRDSEDGSMHLLKAGYVSW